MSRLPVESVMSLTRVSFVGISLFFRDSIENNFCILFVCEESASVRPFVFMDIILHSSVVAVVFILVRIFYQRFA